MDTVADAAFCNHCGERLPARCRACDTLNPPGSAFCYSCGSPIAAAASGATAYAPPPPRASAICPRCSKVSEPGSAYCYSCGLPLDDAPHPSANAAPTAYTRYDSSHAWRGDDYAVGKPAGFWIRLAAFLIDCAVVTAIILAIIFAIGRVSYTAYYEFGTNEAVFNLLFFGTFALYHMIGWSLWQTTVGKRIFNLYVARKDGSKVGFGRSTGRALAYFASSMFFYIGFLMVAFRQDKRALHDLICDTVVIRRRR